MKWTLSTLSAIVVSILALFGGYLTKVAPPVGTSFLTIGFLEFLLLLILLLIAQKKASKAPKWLIILGICMTLTSFIGYFILYSNQVVYVGGKQQVAGNTLQEDWLFYCNSRNLLNCREAVIDRLKEEKISSYDIWYSKEVKRNEYGLIATYCLFVLSVCTTLFLLMNLKQEAASVNRRSTTEPAVT